MTPDDREYILTATGPGWRPLLERLLKKLDALGWDGEVAQVKQKFGTLRFYIGAGSDEIYDAISEAERESAKTCEDCGEPGKLRTKRYWLETLCDDCEENAAKRAT